MPKENSISTSQLFCVLLLCRLSAEIVYPRTVSGTAGEAILALIISEIVRFALALPVIIYSFKGISASFLLKEGNITFILSTEHMQPL